MVMNKPKNYPKISAVICTLNEEKNLQYVLPKIPQWMDEIILVDGQSVDNTVTVAKHLCPEIKVFLQQDKGKGNAIVYDIRWRIYYKVACSIASGFRLCQSLNNKDGHPKN
jgi:glycosyltransferase involved in cell wall biosynthesis